MWFNPPSVFRAPYISMLFWCKSSPLEIWHPNTRQTQSIAFTLLHPARHKCIILYCLLKERIKMQSSKRNRQNWNKIGMQYRKLFLQFLGSLVYGGRFYPKGHFCTELRISPPNWGNIGSFVGNFHDLQLKV